MSNIGHQVNDLQRSIARPDFLTAITTGLSEVPVVALLGARQVGKTDLARQTAAMWPGPSAAFDWRPPLTVKPWERLQDCCFATARGRSQPTKSIADLSRDVASASLLPSGVCLDPSRSAWREGRVRQAARPGRGSQRLRGSRIVPERAVGCR